MKDHRGSPLSPVLRNDSSIWRDIGAAKCAMSRVMKKMPRTQDDSHPMMHPRTNSVDGDGGAGRSGADFGDAGGDGAGQGVEALGGWRGFALACHWFAGVATDADPGVDFDFAEDGDAVSDGGFCAFAVAEDVDGLVAVGALEGAHVFDYAEDFYVDLAKHFDGFADVGQGHCRGRGDYYRAGYGYRLD